MFVYSQGAPPSTFRRDGRWCRRLPQHLVQTHVQEAAQRQVGRTNEHVTKCRSDVVEQEEQPAIDKDTGCGMTVHVDFLVSLGGGGEAL